jgi:formylglycine-generating enzyme required for sulfatase activity
MPDDEGWCRKRRPVINVSFADALAYCDWLSQVANAQYRLPTEAEWEYACRAETTTAFNVGDKLGKKQANFNREAIKGKTKKVGSFPANAWGLYDMHGNVAEWCADGMREYSRHPMTDPLGPRGSKMDRVTRGGSWFDFGWACSSTHRVTTDPDDQDDKIGFRCARDLI